MTLIKQALQWTILSSLLFASQMSLANTTQTIETGENLFKQHCVACHGLEGQGGIGLPLSKPSIISSLTDEYIRNTIVHGRPGRVMPAFKHLPNEDIEAIVIYMRSWGESKVNDDSSPIAGNAKNGQTLYQAHCAECHADDLSGALGTGVTHSRPRSHEIMPPALNNQGFLRSASDQLLKHIIVEGRIDMPSFKDKLSDQETNDIVAYIRSHDEQAAKQTDPQSPVFVYEVDSSFDETVDRIREVLNSSNYRVFPDRYLEQGLTDEFSTNKRQKIIRFCNFKKLYDAIRIEPRLGTVLPCKMTVIETEDGTVKIITANVRAQIEFFNNKQLEKIVDDVEQSYADIIEEVTF